MMYFLWIYEDDSPNFATQYVEAVVGPFKNVEERGHVAILLREMYPERKVVYGSLMWHNLTEPHIIEMFKRCGAEIPKKGTS